MRYRSRQLSQKGFTIVELMIATSVLSTILLLVTVIMISIGNLYYKGVNQARVQDDVHSIVDDVSQHLELGATSNPTLVTSTDGQTMAYCIGDTRYVFTIGKQIGTGLDTDGTTHQSPHVLWRDKAPAGCATSSTLNSFLNNTFLSLTDSSGTELIAPNSRLTSLCISGTVVGSCVPDAPPYTVSVSVAYGAIDLLNDPASSTATCKDSTGDQFCSTANLTTVVAQRLAP